MSILTIQRLGGIAGFGGPHLQSEGKMAIADLQPADRAAVEAMFEGGDKPDMAGSADMFRYRITRARAGKSEAIEVPEKMVPAALLASVKDRLD